ncbi:hypothetical protein C8J57DRAFT_1314149, partial [Mycena rebaudengoi]
ILIALVLVPKSIKSSKKKSMEYPFFVFCVLCFFHLVIGSSIYLSSVPASLPLFLLCFACVGTAKEFEGCYFILFFG